VPPSVSCPLAPRRRCHAAAGGEGLPARDEDVRVLEPRNVVCNIYFVYLVVGLGPQRECVDD
jgi:hypothetical protein